jgi:uncharacterized protein (TIGR02996 family)
MSEVLDDLDARLVYADELQQQGDPLGELITVQHALEQQRAKLPAAQVRKLERRAITLLEQHHEAMFGPLAPHTRKPSHGDQGTFALTVTWRSGFADEIRIESTEQIELVDIYTQLLALPIVRFMTKLVVGRPVFGASDGSYKPLLSTVVHFEPPPHLQTLVLGDVRPGQTVLVNVHKLQATLDRCTQLERLAIMNARGIIGPLASERLRSLSITNMGEPSLGHDLYEIASSALPALTELTMLHAYARSILRNLPGSSLLGTLTTLSMRHGGLDDHDLLLVCSRSECFAHLTRLDLRNNNFESDTILATRTRLPRLKA